LLLGCAQPPIEAPRAPVPDKPVELPQLPATFVSPSGCQAATVTLRPDGSFLLRDQLGASEFYDFGRWRLANGRLELAGDRDTRTYSLANLRRAPKVEVLRGPFRMVGLYDGATFTECRTQLKWPLSATRAADVLKQEYVKGPGKPALVALDAQFEGSPETLRVLRPASLLDKNSCS
jgi:NlpE C-terminal OB domain